MFIDHDGRVAGDVAGDFLFSFFIDETSEPTNVNVMAIRHVGFYNIEECFYRSGYIGFIDSCFLGNLVDYIGFSHKELLKGRKVNGQLFKRKMNLLIITHLALRRFSIRWNNGILRDSRQTHAKRIFFFKNY